jgi:cyclic dehypoxanthinyl futalosine synthase
MGAKVGLVALRFGADDMGSTLMEENVVRAAGVSHRQSRDVLVRLIADAGFEPARRDCLYDRVWPVEESQGPRGEPCPTEKTS